MWMSQECSAHPGGWKRTSKGQITSTVDVCLASYTCNITGGTVWEVPVTVILQRFFCSAVRLCYILAFC